MDTPPQLLPAARPAERYPKLELLRPTLATLNVYAVEFRYPGETADKEVARQAVKLAEEVKGAVLGLIG